MILKFRKHFFLRNFFYINNSAILLLSPSYLKTTRLAGDFLKGDAKLFCGDANTWAGDVSFLDGEGVAYTFKGDANFFLGDGVAKTFSGDPQMIFCGVL